MAGRFPFGERVLSVADLSAIAHLSAVVWASENAQAG